MGIKIQFEVQNISEEEYRQREELYTGEISVPDDYKSNRLLMSSIKNTAPGILSLIIAGMEEHFRSFDELIEYAGDNFHGPLFGKIEMLYMDKLEAIGFMLETFGVDAVCNYLVEDMCDVDEDIAKYEFDQMLDNELDELKFHIYHTLNVVYTASQMCNNENLFKKALSHAELSEGNAITESPWQKEPKVGKAYIIKLDITSKVLTDAGNIDVPLLAMGRAVHALYLDQLDSEWGDWEEDDDDDI